MNNSNEVLVYFHGSFGFRSLEPTKTIEVYVPNILAHANLIGTWKGLYNLEKGYKYSLEGAITASRKPEMDPNANVVFDKLSRPERVEDYFCLIELPWPESIDSLSMERIQKDSLFSKITSSAGKSIPQPDSLAHVHLYRYSKNKNGEPIRFVGTAQSGVQNPVEQGPFADQEGRGVFHLFSEPPHVFLTDSDRNGKMAAPGMQAMPRTGSRQESSGLDAIRLLAPFTKHEHLALQEVLRMFPETKDVEVHIPDAAESSDSPPRNSGNGIDPMDLRSLYHLYPHFEGGPPACNPGSGDGN